MYFSRVSLLNNINDSSIDTFSWLILVVRSLIRYTSTIKSISLIRTLSNNKESLALHSINNKRLITPLKKNGEIVIFVFIIALLFFICVYFSLYNSDIIADLPFFSFYS